jgi:hypothetical protein
MLRKLLFILLLSVSLPLIAAEYVGTMQMEGGFKLKEVRVSLDEQGNITMYDVKFARMMPVRVDVRIPGVKRQQGQLSGDKIIPYVGNKPQPKRIVTRLRGTANKQTLSFRCEFGDKEMQFQGKAK